MGKNRKAKRILAILIALTICMLAVPGCSNDKKKDKSSETKSDVKEEKTDEGSNEDTEKDTGKKISDGIINLPVGDKIDFSGAKLDDCITFGRYEQDNDTSNGKEDIEWIVIGKEDGKLFLMSKYALDCKKYNEENKEVTWETCTLRTWLNNDFLNTAFTSKEQRYIATTEVKNDDNVYIDLKKEYKIPGGNDTQDKIFLLSVDEARTYFKEEHSEDEWSEIMLSRTRSCFPTEFAKIQGVTTETRRNYVKDSWSNGCCERYWLRTPGWSNEYVSTIRYDGAIDKKGAWGMRNDVDADSYGVRPVMWVNITS